MHLMGRCFVISIQNISQKKKNPNIEPIRLRAVLELLAMIKRFKIILIALLHTRIRIQGIITVARGAYQLREFR